MILSFLALFSFLITCTVITVLNPVATKFGLVDLPNQRKSHSGEVPLVGGIAIYISILIISTFAFDYTYIFNLYFISASLILFIGVLDDKYDLPVSLRLIAQVITASILIFGAGLYIESFGKIFYFFEFEFGAIGSIITIFAVLGAINAFNMIDGIDGLAGMLSVVAFSSLAILFFSSNSSWFILAILFTSAIFGYLVFNLRWPLASVEKVFMGDAGSMLIGLTIVWMLVVGVDAETEAFRPVTALYIVAIPLMDMVAIMYRRIKKGQSAFEPDRDHLHHIFERAGFNRKQTLILITLFAISLAVIGVLGEYFLIPEWVMFSIFIVLFVIYSSILQNIWKVLSWLNKKKLES